MNKVKFLAFADYHYYPKYILSDQPGRFEKIRDRAALNDVDFVIQLGDLCHQPSKMQEIVKKYSAFPMPAYHVFGNHEFDNDTLEEALSGYGLGKSYYYIDINCFRFIITDTNYIYDNGEYIHFSKGNYFKYYPRPETFCYINDEQMQWIENTIMESPYPCIVFGHESFDRQNVAIKNKQQFHDIIKRVNQDKKRLFLCIHGHRHRDHIRVRNDVCFFEVNSSSFEWIAGKTHDKFPPELVERYKNINHTIVYNEPVSAVITISEDGFIKIEGMNGSYYSDVCYETLGAEYKDADPDGIKCTPNILSAEIHIPVY